MNELAPRALWFLILLVRKLLLLKFLNRWFHFCSCCLGYLLFSGEQILWHRLMKCNELFFKTNNRFLFCLICIMNKVSTEDEDVLKKDKITLLAKVGCCISILRLVNLKVKKSKCMWRQLRYGFSGQELLSMFVLWSVREGIWGKGQLESKTKIFFPLRQYTGGWYFTIFAHLLSSILFVCFFFFTYDVYGTTNGARFQQGHDLRSSGVPDLLNNPYSTRIGWELIINGFRA